MDPEVQAKIKALDQAREELKQALYAGMDRAFRQHGFDAVRVNAYDTWLKKGRREMSHVLGEVSIPEYDELEELYLHHVCPQGFEGDWTEEAGWENTSTL